MRSKARLSSDELKKGHAFFGNMPEELRLALCASKGDEYAQRIGRAVKDFVKKKKNFE